MAEDPIEIGLADGNPLMLGALSEVLDNDPRFSLVLTSKTTETFLETLLQTDIGVGIVDWELPGLGTETLLEIMRQNGGGPKIIVYAQDLSGEVAKRAMAGGAAAYFSRNDPPERLMDLIEEVAAGRMVFPFVDVRELRRDPMDSLTEKERELLEHLAQGHSNRDLAKTLDISVNTVKFHLRSIFDKLAVNSRTQAIALYYASPVTRARSG